MAPPELSPPEPDSGKTSVSRPTAGAGEGLGRVARHRLLVEWNDTARPDADPRATFPRLFAARARTAPDAVAVVDPVGGAGLSYGALELRSARVAEALRRGGAGPERRVCVELEASLDGVVAAVGILRAGAVYVPLDPSYPAERLERMRRDADPVATITPAWLAALDAVDPCEDAGVEIDPASAAYVLYTSGSTGTPKGVVVPQGALGWYCLACGEHYALRPGDRVLQVASISFDISVGEIFPCLAMGATLVLRDRAALGGVVEFFEFADRERLSVLLPPTAFWHELAAQIEHLDISFPPSLRLISFGGEKVLPERVAAWTRAVGGRVRLVNGYGPTETTVEASIHQLVGPRGAAPTGAEGPSRIGRPVARARVYVVDGGLRPVAPGVAGELCIGGGGLARGYLRHPRATAERFVPDPFAAEGGARLYRSGDRVRWSEDGELEIFGRLDAQVKIRGFRVEPGEVEGVLTRHPSVRDAAVVASEMADGARRLVAFVVGEAKALGGWLGELLPSHLVPSAIHGLDALPLTPVGKIDRRRLEGEAARRWAARRRAASGATGADDPRVALLQRLWAEALDVAEVAPDDDFFALGGHSLAAVRLIGRLRAELGVDLPLAALFDAPTPAALARRLGEDVGAGVPDQVREALARRFEDGDEAPLSFAQQRFWTLHHLDPGGAADPTLLDVWRIDGPLDADALDAALTALAARHDVLRTRYPSPDARPCQVAASPSRGMAARVDLGALTGEAMARESERLARGLALRPFDLERGPLWRVVLLRLGADRESHRLLRVVHHSLSDGMSEEIFYRDLGILYAAAVPRRSARLPRLAVRQADVAAWQRRTWTDARLAEALDFWRRRLADPPPPLLLPGDLRSAAPPRPLMRLRRLPEGLATSLEHLANNAGATRFMLWLTVFAVCLRRWTGREDFVVGTPVQVRPPEAEGVLGCFLNSLPLRLELGRERDFATLLAEVRGVVLDAHAHREAPFESIVRAVREVSGEVEADAVLPLFQVVCDVQHRRELELELDGASARWLEPPTQASPFEPSLTVFRDRGGWVLSLDADGARFAPSTLDRWLADLEETARQGVAGREVDLSGLSTTSSLLPEAPPGQAGTEPSAPVPSTLAEVALEGRLQALWRDVLEVDEVAPEANFFALGGDSLLSIRLVARAHREGLAFGARDLFLSPTVRDLARRITAWRIAARRIAARHEQAPARVPTPGDDALAERDIPLLPIQRRFLAWELDAPHHDNQSRRLRLAEAVEVDRLRRGVEILIRRHDALRLRFARRADGTWTQRAARAGGEPPVHVVDLGGLARRDRRAAGARACADAQRSLDLARGPLLRAVLLCAPEADDLLLAIHHLAVDAVSWTVLLDELELAVRGRPLPPPPTPFAVWARRAAECEWAAEEGWAVDDAAGSIASEETVTVDLDAARGAVLRGLAGRRGATVQDLLLAALVEALGRAIDVELESHGRDDEELDLSRTVGWLTRTHVATLENGDLVAVREAVRRALRGEGASTGRPELLFNYLGRLDAPSAEGLFVDAPDSPGPERGRGGRRTHRFEINAGTRGGRLEIEWAFSRRRDRRAEVEGLAEGMSAALAAWVDAPPAAAPGDPLTPLQEGMLFHSLLAPGSGVYVEQAEWESAAEVDLAALRAGWGDVTARHEILRTAFIHDGLERPRQIVARRVALPWTEVDLAALAASRQAATWRRIVLDDRRRDFDLGRAPLQRWILRRDPSPDGSRRLLWTSHHILLDGWSAPRVVEDLATAYAARRRSGAPRWRSAAPPFRRFLAWLTERDARGGAARDRAFWRDHLAGFDEPTPLPIPLSAPRSGAPRAPHGEVRRTLSAARFDALRGVARAAGLTPSSLVQGAWALLLARLAGARQVVFGITVAGRPPELPGAFEMVGLLANTLPLRVATRPGDAVASLLGRLQQAQAEVQEHAWTPLVEIQARSPIAPPRALFDTLLVYESYAARGASPGGLPLREVDGSSRTNYPLTLSVVPGDDLTLFLAHQDCAPLDAARLLRTFDVVLEGLVGALESGGGAAWEALPLLGRAEHQHLLREFGDTRRDDLAPSPLDILVADRARLVPDAVAVVEDGRALSYGALLARAEALAAGLRGRGVGIEDRVGVALERSLEMVVALLGILRAGAAYVPLDPDEPEARRRRVEEDADLAAVVDLATVFELVAVADLEELANPPVDRAVYVLYTSGSTGQPKGVVNHHRGVANRILWLQDVDPLGPADRVLQKTPLGFDVSAWEIFWPLVAGARLVLAPPGGHRDAARLADLLACHEVTTVHFVPSMLAPFLREDGLCEDGSRAFPALRRVLTSGEALTPELVGRVDRHLGIAPDGPTLRNLYGPTEASIEITSWLRPPRKAAVRRVPIGRPIAGARVHVVDARLRLLPWGAVGELCLGGIAPARGYHGMPSRTAESFVPDPFVDRGGGARLYRSGDRARIGGDGAVDYLGRLDEQIKIRGVRIEPGEVEAAVRAHPEVADAAVLATSSPPLLTAFVQGRGGTAPRAEELRRAVLGRLPAALVPSVWIGVDALPRTPSGKVDRRALRRRLEHPEGGAGDDAARQVVRRRPRGPVETTLAELWRQALHLDADAPPLHRADDFFALGGHSLAAVRLAGRMRRAFGVEPALRELFERPTLREQAELLDGALAEGVPVEAAVDESAVEADRLSFDQERLWFLQRLDPRSAAYHMTSAWHVDGPLDLAALDAALGEIARRHDVLRTTFTAVDGVPRRRTVAAPTPTMAALVDLSAVADRVDAARLLAGAARRPFVLDAPERGLWRVVVARLGEGRQVLTRVVHHLVGDGASEALFHAELASLYRAARRGDAARLPRLTATYDDFVRRQRARLGDAVLEQLTRRARRRLLGAGDGDALPVLEVPADRARRGAGHALGRRSHLRARRLAPELAGRLRRAARQHGASLYMLGAATYLALLSRLSGSREIVFAIPADGRDAPRFEPLLGFFIGTLAARLELRRGDDLPTLLGRARAAVLDAWADRALPFDRLVAALEPARDLARHAVFQVLIDVREEAPSPLDLDGASTRWLPLVGGGTELEPSLSVWGEEASGEETLGLAIEADAALFDAVTLDRLLARYEVLLDAWSAAPEQALEAMPWMARGERHQVLHELSIVAERPSPPTVLERFDAVVRRSPDAVAVEELGAGGGRSTTWTYGELARRVDHLAARLLAEAPTGGERRLGLALGRSARLPLALLAALRAGIAWVPLDPDQPMARREHIRRDAAPDTVLDDAGIDRLLAAAPGIPPSPAAVDPRALAYVLYTSGSTGRPKGVEIPRRALDLFLDAFGARLGWNGSTTLLALTTIGFDISILELLGPLVHGGRVAVADRSVAVDGRALAEALEDARANVLQATPATWRLLVEVDWRPARRRVRILSGGEALPRDLAVELAARGETWNLYGPTEATIWVAVGRSTAISGPLPGVRLHVLDRRLAPVPLGAAGEICLGGSFLARGYRGRGAHTAERFVPDPRAAAHHDAGGRLYRTGDLGRLRADGRIEFLGRVDQQIKLRGHRIELGEIESVLAEHPAVERAVVLLEEERLVAHLRAAPGRPPLEIDLDAVRAWLGERLPRAMIPAVLVIHGELPWTPSGKVDRRALGSAVSLPGAPLRGASGVRARALPSDPIGRAVAEIWRELLGAAPVDGEAQFFAVGGHSLLAARLVARVGERLGVDLPLRDVFEHPRLDALVARINALLAARLRAGTGPDAPRVRRIDRGGELPLSFVQERLWFLHQLDPALAADHLPHAWDLRGALDISRLAAAWRALARRHELLRGRFPSVDGRPRLEIAAAVEIGPARVDLSALPGLRRELEAGRLTAELAARPFDPASAPPWRVALLRLDGARHRLVRVLHHLLTDAASDALLDAELAMLYDGRQPSPRGLDYVDFAAWQRRTLGGAALEELLGDWARRLEQYPLALEVPTDRPHRAARRRALLRVGAARHGLDAAETDAFRRLAHDAGATLAMAVGAVWQVVLGRLSGRRRLLIGSPSVERPSSELEGVVGPFVNTLILAADLRGAPDAETLLGRARGAALDAYAARAAPFERIVERLQPERRLDRHPVIQTMVDVHPEPPSSPRLGELEVRELEVEVAAGEIELWLTAWRRADGGLHLELFADAGLFDRTTVERYLRGVRELALAMARQPRRPVEEFALESRAMRHQMLHEWGSPPSDRRSGAWPRPLLERVAEQARRAPDAVAVVAAEAGSGIERTLTYAALWRRVLRLARRLSEHGIGPESRVALSLQRGVDLPTALLGVLGAGAAWVPLAADHPAVRLAGIRRDAAPDLELDDARLTAWLGGAPIDVSTLADEGPAIAADAHPDALAYILYTSGSTGEPKGVEIRRRSLDLFLDALGERLGWSRGGLRAPRLLAVTTLHFDISTVELLLPLAHGGRVLVTPHAVAGDGFALRRAVEIHRPTVLQATPSTWRMLVDAGWGGDGALQVLSGGEALSGKLARQLAARGGELWNLYGPTEATVWATAKRWITMKHWTDDATGGLDLGRPLAGIEARLLDDRLRRSPLGAIGEIHLAGEALARGYRGRPARTAESFVPDPDAAEPGGRLYRTGDLARRRADGGLEFLGRRDHQIKVRGHRVELDEVESVLASHPAVGEGVVLFDGEGLIAHLRVAALGGALDPLDPLALRAWLGERLPRWMVPGAYVLHAALPRTAAGKIDRRALELHAPDLAPSRAISVAPRGTLERRMAALWAELLGHERIGRREDFFALGGHSLAAVRLMARVEQELGARPPLAELFDEPTVEGLTRRVRTLLGPSPR